jgi:hypothetical protein
VSDALNEGHCGLGSRTESTGATLQDRNCHTQALLGECKWGCDLADTEPADAQDLEESFTEVAYCGNGEVDAALFALGHITALKSQKVYEHLYQHSPLD